MEAAVDSTYPSPREAKPSHLDTDMQRICALPPVIMVQLHNRVYSLNVWTLWSTVPKACGATAQKPDIMLNRVRYLLPTQTERRFKGTLCAPLDDVLCRTQWPGDDHTRAIANHSQKSEIRGCERERIEAPREKERVPALMNHWW